MNAFDFIPQGGGDHDHHHRCAGEWITIGLMKLALDMLVDRLDYRVPAQELRLPPRRLPPLPRSGFVIDTINLKHG